MYIKHLNDVKDAVIVKYIINIYFEPFIKIMKNILKYKLHKNMMLRESSLQIDTEIPRFIRETNRKRGCCSKRVTMTMSNNVVNR